MKMKKVLTQENMVKLEKHFTRQYSKKNCVLIMSDARLE